MNSETSEHKEIIKEIIGFYFKQKSARNDFFMHR